jgi:hypothetical protein
VLGQRTAHGHVVQVAKEAGGILNHGLDPVRVRRSTSLQVGSQ